MLTDDSADVITTGGADRNWRRVLKAGLAGLGVVVVAVVGVVITRQVLWNTVSVSMSGTYTTSDAPDQVRSVLLRQVPPEELPPPNATVVTLQWTDRQHRHWPATDCSFSVMLAHPRQVQAIGMLGAGYDASGGGSGTQQKVLADHPDIPRTTDEFGTVVFAGTTFGVAADTARPPLTVVLDWGSSPPDDALIRVGVAYVCNGRDVAFHWLTHVG